MNGPSNLKITMYNIILNAYETKRPRQTEAVIDIKPFFEKHFIHKTKHPIQIDINGKHIKNIQINTSFICTPGGRGCIGKERLGKKITDRQVIMINSVHGTVKSKKYENNKNFGFITLLAECNYTNGETSNMSINIEPSGILVIRSGGFSLLKKNSSISSIISDLENLLLYFKIDKVRDSKISLINGNFNLITKIKKRLFNDKGKRLYINTQRPKIEKFKQFVDIIYRSGLDEKYKKPTKPWLSTQGTPTVIKSVFKSNDTEYPTLTLSAYGYCEIMGAKTFSSIIKAYDIIIDSFKAIDKRNYNIRVPDSVKKTTNNSNIKQKMKKSNTSIRLNYSNNYKVEKNELIFGKKLCVVYPKPVIQYMARLVGVSDIGKKDDLCNRIKKAIYY